MLISGIQHSDSTITNFKIMESIKLQNAHHTYIYYLSPKKVSVILLTTSPILYFSSPRLIYFITGSLSLVSFAPFCVGIIVCMNSRTDFLSSRPSIFSPLCIYSIQTLHLVPHPKWISFFFLTYESYIWLCFLLCFGFCEAQSKISDPDSVGHNGLDFRH